MKEDKNMAFLCEIVNFTNLKQPLINRLLIYEDKNKKF